MTGNVIILIAEDESGVSMLQIPVISVNLTAKCCVAPKGQELVCFSASARRLKTRFTMAQRFVRFCPNH